MIRVGKEFSFDAAHRLQGHDRLCQFLHGHTWRVVVSYEGSEVQESGSSRGMLLDFGDIKKEIQRLVERLDHAVILEEGDPLIAVLQTAKQRVCMVPFRPTAENFAAYFLTALDADSVRVYETPGNYAEAYHGGL